MIFQRICKEFSKYESEVVKNYLSWTYRTSTSWLLLYIEWGAGCYLYRVINSEDDKYKTVPSLVLDQLIVSSTFQENAFRQKQDSLDPPQGRIVSQMQSTVLQDKSIIKSENQDLTSTEIDTTKDIIWMEKEISELKVRYKKKRQKLEQ